MRKPPAPVLRGLQELASFVEAGGSADIIGYDYDSAPKEDQKRWEDIEAAVEWIKQQ